ncbi:MAG: hypothetical protein EBY88_07230 [Actinobacteria bacterium]|nr:hypothetical protein [Actinomycetota bacterium]
MSNDDETPEDMDEAEVEGVDSDDLENLDVDPDDLDEGGDESDESGEDVVEDALPGEEVEGEAAEGDTAAATDEERLNLDDTEEEERPRRRRRDDEDENELATADDQEEDLLKILEDKLRTSDEFAPEGEETPFEADDSTDGTPLIQPRRPDEDHCQQCFLLVRKSAPKCPVDHDLCPKFPVA